jgi:hypothetical protein
MFRQQRLIRRRREAAREVVGAAIALGLADQRDDVGGVDRAGVDLLSQLRHIVGSRHRDLVHADLHSFLTLLVLSYPSTPSGAALVAPERLADCRGQTRGAPDAGQHQ